MKATRQILSLTTALVVSTAACIAQADSHGTTCDEKELVEAGTLTGEGKSVGFVVGVRWGQGVVRMNNGTTFKFKAKGGKAMEMGAAATKFSGTVYNLQKPADFAGVYSGLTGGVTVAKAGAGFVELTNGNCVVLKLKRHDPKGLQGSAPMLSAIEVEVVE